VIASAWERLCGEAWRLRTAKTDGAAVIDFRTRVYNWAGPAAGLRFEQSLIGLSILSDLVTVGVDAAEAHEAL
jgi:hypothetical protein